LIHLAHRESFWGLEFIRAGPVFPSQRARFSNAVENRLNFFDGFKLRSRSREGMNYEEVFDLPRGAKYHGPKLRFHRVCNEYDDSGLCTEVDHCPQFKSCYEFIGYRLDRDDPVDGDEWDTPLNSLYQDIRGFLHYCWGYEFEVGSWDVHVEIICRYWCYGKNLEEIRARFRNDFGPDAEIPSILEFPPEVETMHEMIDYDS
jgi:hypothetical protein